MIWIIWLMLASVCSAAEQTPVDRMLDRVVKQERDLMTLLAKHNPIVETYIQVQPSGTSSEAAPIEKDVYFLGRMNLTNEVSYEALLETETVKKAGRSIFGRSSKPKEFAFLPRGFAQMSLIDSQAFNRTTYKFEYVRREFLGDVRCFVFDIAPFDASVRGKFVGRIWVEDIDFHVVRFNGTYTDPPGDKNRTGTPEQYFHFDSWRTNVYAGAWLPAQVYVEESDASPAPRQKLKPVKFKAQIRFWGYQVAAAPKLDELTSILLDKDSGLKDQAELKDPTPLESQRAWERQAEENILNRLERGGLLAPLGPVDEVLNTVINNLLVTNNLNLDVKCRVLVTTPLETFSIGQTIVISRGLVDVLPDEASLALVLAGELSHIALGHRTNTQFAFHNQTMGTDEEILHRFRFARSEVEADAAGRKTVELMKTSPYKKLANAGLFLKALGARGPILPRLIHANFGNRLTGDASVRLSEFVSQAPPLDEAKLEQIAALPLGSRIKLNPWNNALVLLKNKPLSVLSAREKMPFEVTPFQLHLTRIDSPAATSAAPNAGQN